MAPRVVPPRFAALQSAALPGLGQRRLGEDRRGYWHTALALGAMLLAVAFGYMGPPWVLYTLPAFLFAVLVWTFSVWDAYALARARAPPRLR